MLKAMVVLDARKREKAARVGIANGKQDEIEC